MAKKADSLVVEKKALVETIEKSIPDQIYEELIKSIKASGRFDTDSLNRLEALTVDGGIRKSAEVIKVIRKTAEEQHEAS